MCIRELFNVFFSEIHSVWMLYTYFLSFYYVIFHNLFIIMMFNQPIIKILRCTQFVETFFWNILKVMLIITNDKACIYFKDDTIL